MKIRVYTLKDNPIAWKRAGITGNGSRHYDTQSLSKERTRLELMVQKPDLIATGPIFMGFKFYIQMRQLMSAKKRKEMEGKPHSQKPDADNLIKYLLDTLNGLTYTDDAQVARIEISKEWSSEPRTEITIYSLE